MVGALDRLHSASWILGKGDAKPIFRLARSVVAHGDQHRHTSVGPALYANTILDHVAAGAQIAEGSIGVGQTHRLFAHRLRPILIASSAES